MIAAAAALGAGAYYFLGPNKKAHQKKAKALYEKIKKEAKKEGKKLKSEWRAVSAKTVKRARKTKSKK